MSKISSPQRSSLNQAVHQLVSGRDIESAKPDILKAVHDYFQTHAMKVRDDFEREEKPANVLSKITSLLDAIIETLFDVGRKAYANNDEVALCIIAVGGYGRKEQYPSSDVDLLILIDEQHLEIAQRIAEFILYILWDLRLTVGQAVRTVEDSLQKAREDITIRTTMLDARYLCGSTALFEEFNKRFENEVMADSEAQFVEAKLKERDQRHLKCGDSRYVLEPNIKEGKGALRDLHTIYWLAKYCYRVKQISELVKLGVFTPEEYKSYTKALTFLSLVRIHLHYLAGRGEERLTFDMQKTIGERLGYKEHSGSRSVERFMKRYFIVARMVGNLTRTFCAVLEEERRRKPRISLGELMSRNANLGAFILDGERLNVASEDAFEKTPHLLIDLFHKAQENDLDIHPRALRLVTRNLHLINREMQDDAQVNDIFMSILMSRVNPEITLRRMNEAGVLGRLIPDFGRVTGQMQYDMYHVYTVDEHTIFAIGLLHHIEKGKYVEELPLATEIFPHIESRRVLYLALFCHDIAKGRGGDHSILGEKVAEKLADRFGFSPKEKETTAWLVRYHLLMSRTAFKRDVNDPKTIEDFVAKVQSPERLRLLLVLTVADIRAVGPTVWNGWKGALLRDLYYYAEEKMGARRQVVKRNQQESLVKELKILLSGWPLADIEAYVELGSPGFWASVDPSGHARIARMLKEILVMQTPVMVDTYIDTFRSITEITICTPDQHGLFAKISGVMALADANILNSKIYTLKNGMAVDTFWVQDAEGNAYDRPDKLAKLSTLLEMVLSGRLDLDKELSRNKKTYPSRLEVFKVPPGVYIENKLSNNYTVIEVNGRDRIGFLYSVTKALADLGLSISTAHITTYGERAVDVFYVKDIFGMKIYHESKIRQIREVLMGVLRSPGGDTEHKGAA